MRQATITTVDSHRRAIMVIILRFLIDHGKMAVPRNVDRNPPDAMQSARQGRRQETGVFRGVLDARPGR